MKFILWIDVDSMTERDEEVASLLESCAARVRNSEIADYYRPIRDFNGNDVGRLGFKHEHDLPNMTKLAKT